PGLVGRVQAYMDKALKEAKVHTTWTNPDARYDDAMRSFVAAVLGAPAFLAELLPFARRIARAADLSSLAQTALKLVVPGVADVSQGCELQALSLVAPDNRRPVDWARREKVLDEIRAREDRAALARELGATLADGRAKLMLLAAGLGLRRREPELFARGSYAPLEVVGRQARHVVALARAAGERTIVCVAPRLVLQPGAGDAWDGGVRGRAGELTCVVTGERVGAKNGVLSLADCFAGFPVGLFSTCPARARSAPGARRSAAGSRPPPPPPAATAAPRRS